MLRRLLEVIPMGHLKGTVEMACAATGCQRTPLMAFRGFEVVMSLLCFLYLWLWRLTLHPMCPMFDLHRWSRIVR